MFYLVSYVIAMRKFHGFRFLETCDEFCEPFDFWGQDVWIPGLSCSIGTSQRIEIPLNTDFHDVILRYLSIFSIRCGLLSEQFKIVSLVANTVMCWAFGGVNLAESVLKETLGLPDRGIFRINCIDESHSPKELVQRLFQVSIMFAESKPPRARGQNSAMHKNKTLLIYAGWISCCQDDGGGGLNEMWKSLWEVSTCNKTVF